MLHILLTILGVILIVVGVIWLLSHALIAGIVLIIVGLLLAGWAGHTHYGNRGPTTY